MRIVDLQMAFELEIDKRSDIKGRPNTYEISYWLNAGIDKFIKTRAFGMNPKLESFEQSQKRRDDLSTLVKDHEFTTSDSDRNNIPVEYEYPKDYLYLLGESAIISTKYDGIKYHTWSNDIMLTDVIECTIDNLHSRFNNSFSDHHYYSTKVRPLSVKYDNKSKIYTDGNYDILKYNITYISKPDRIDINNTTVDDMLSEYISLPQHTHIEFVKLAAQMYIENKKSERYNSFSNEVNQME